MALPFPSSPNIDENVGDSIDRIEQNLEYLDGTITNPFKFSVKSASFNSAGTIDVNGVGFLPKAVFVIADTNFGSGGTLSWGVIGDDLVEMCMYQKYVGTPYVSNAAFFYIEQTTGNGYEGTITSFHADGIIIEVAEFGTPESIYIADLYFLFIG